MNAPLHFSAKTVLKPLSLLVIEFIIFRNEFRM